MGWAIACTEHVIHLFDSESPDDPRPRQALDTARAWLRGEVPMKDAHRAAFVANSAAKGLPDPERLAALSAGQTVAVAHVAAHDLGAAAYAIRAAQAATPADPGARRAERDW